MAVCLAVPVWFSLVAKPRCGVLIRVYVTLPANQISRISTEGKHRRAAGADENHSNSVVKRRIRRVDCSIHQRATDQRLATANSRNEMEPILL